MKSPQLGQLPSRPVNDKLKLVVNLFKMAMVPYNKRSRAVTKKNKNKPRYGDIINAFVDPNQLAYDVGLGAIRGVGELAKQAFTGVVSAFQARGASRNEIKAIVAPLARSLAYTSRKPKFMKAEGGLMIEHIESVPVLNDGHTTYSINSNTFRWLSGIAKQFEEYSINLAFAWNPICPATTTGQVLMAFDYDPEDTGGYTVPADYFNTADHCVSAIWAQGAISPQKSGWLKTGEDGQKRLYSPGTLHMSVTDHAAGFLTVKYQVSLRKPQPNDNNDEVIYEGYFGETVANFLGGATLISGNPGLVSTIDSTILGIAPTPGYKIVTWSTEGAVAAFSYAAGFGCRTLGQRTGLGALYAMVVKPNTQGLLTMTLAATPGSPLHFRLKVTSMETNPLDYEIWD